VVNPALCIKLRQISKRFLQYPSYFFTYTDPHELITKSSPKLGQLGGL
jgi:hypothetical protein